VAHEPHTPHAVSTAPPPAPVPDAGTTPVPGAAARPGAPAPLADLTWARDLVAPALRAAVETLPPPERRVAAYHRGWCGPDGGPVPEHRARDGGKVVRPALALLGALAVGAPADKAVPGAVAVELVHDFSLLHDDVIDADGLRRHRPAAWTVFGTPAAVLTGDALLVTAVDALRATPAAVTELTTALVRLLDGQSLDVSFEKRERAGEQEYLDMAAGKTGSLMACACALGAVHAGAPGDRVAALRDFGRHLGVAYQITDDVLGIWGDPRRSGKPSGTDLRARKKTFPVVAALADPGPAGRRLAALYARAAPPDAAEAALLADLVDRAGGRARAVAEAERHSAAALRALARAAPEPDTHDRLRAVARMLTHRDH
jgi:geranylgeranyl diphosphate synthase type I